MALSGNLMRKKTLSGTILRASGGGSSITVDSVLSATSENPVQNKVIKAALDGKAPDLLFIAAYDESAFADLDTAYQNGKTLVCVKDGMLYALIGHQEYDESEGTMPSYTFGASGNGSYTTLVCRDSGFSALWSMSTTSYASTTSPRMDGAAAVGASATYARADHRHPTDTSRAAAADLAAKADKLTEVTISTAGAVTQALDAGKIYHFTGALTALTITLNAPASGDPAQYHFDFLSGSTAPTLTLPGTVTMPDSFSVEADKRYEVDILNNYGAVMAWANS